MSHAANLLEGGRAALDALSESDGAVLSALNAMVHRLRQLAEVDPALGDVVTALEAAEVQAEEAAHSLTRYVDRLELDPERLQVVEERMQALHTAARKFRVPPEQLPDELLARRQQLDDLQAAQDLNKITAREAAARAAYLTIARHLSESRREAAERLSAAVTEAMQGLSMAGGSFTVALHPLDEGASHGLEQVEFLVAGHAGVSPRPLAKVASGGELARISLAISVITSEAAPTPTLIFDEVDTGIGGAVAEVVGRRLQELGRARQVLCVTHLPQVAAQAGTHLLVSKETVGDGGEAVTRSQIRVLDAAGRVVETARMLGGATVTPPRCNMRKRCWRRARAARRRPRKAAARAVRRADTGGARPHRRADAPSTRNNESHRHRKPHALRQAALDLRRPGRHDRRRWPGAPPGQPYHAPADAGGGAVRPGAGRRLQLEAGHAAAGQHHRRPRGWRHPGPLHAAGRRYLAAGRRTAGAGQGTDPLRGQAPDVRRHLAGDRDLAVA